MYVLHYNFTPNVGGRGRSCQGTLMPQQAVAVCSPQLATWSSWWLGWKHARARLGSAPFARHARTHTMP